MILSQSSVGQSGCQHRGNIMDSQSHTSVEKKKILEEVIDEILTIDENIRFVGTHYNNDILTKMKKGGEIYFDSNYCR